LRARKRRTRSLLRRDDTGGLAHPHTAAAGKRGHVTRPGRHARVSVTSAFPHPGANHSAVLPVVRPWHPPSLLPVRGRHPGSPYALRATGKGASSPAPGGRARWTTGRRSAPGDVRRIARSGQPGRRFIHTRTYAPTPPSRVCSPPDSGGSGEGPRAHGRERRQGGRETGQRATARDPGAGNRGPCWPRRGRGQVIRMGWGN
jgi:hypothetical protein